jgi:hypothetical protein
MEGIEINSISDMRGSIQLYMQQYPVTQSGKHYTCN